LNATTAFRVQRCHFGYGGEERCLQVLMGRPEGKRPLGKPQRRWGKMDLQEMGWGHVMG